jgi:ABC-type microcin C transport system duplicated ATPase subunit YejF
MSAPELLEVRDLRICFGQGGSSKPAVEHLSYTLRAGETIALVGQSGSGKTASCRALLGLLPSSAQVTGSARFMGHELLRLKARELQRIRGAGIAMIFQDPARSLNPTMRIGPQIVEGLRQHRRMSQSDARGIAVETLRRLRLSAPEEQFFAYPHQLSGGMQQRVMIGIALACEPRVLIADEATKSLDVITQAQVLRLLKDLQIQLGTALILITHDLRIAAEMSDQVIVMHEGRAVEQGASREVLQQPKSDYTRALLEAVLHGIALPPASAANLPRTEAV